MKELLSYLRALSQMYQHFHWRSSGKNYYGDHLLYERLYGSVNGEIDSVAEKTIGVENDSDAIGPTSDAELTLKLLSEFTSDGDKPEDFAAQAIAAEHGLLKLVSGAMSDASDGVQNLLQSIADTHEGHLYLLQQRTREASFINNQLVRIANKLDQKGYYDLANEIDQIIEEV